MQNIGAASLKLAQHFSEDPAKIKLNECFAIFSDLLDKITSAKKENEMRKKQEARAALLSSQKSQESPTDSAVKRSSRKSVVQEEVCVVDRLLADIRRGDFKLRKSVSG